MIMSALSVFSRRSIFRRSFNAPASRLIQTTTSNQDSPNQATDNKIFLENLKSDLIYAQDQAELRFNQAQIILKECLDQALLKAESRTSNKREMSSWALKKDFQTDLKQAQLLADAHLSDALKTLNGDLCAVLQKIETRMSSTQNSSEQRILAAQEMNKNAIAQQQQELTKEMKAQQVFGEQKMLSAQHEG